VRPGTDDQARRPHPRLFRPLLHSLVLSQGLPNKTVVPAPDVEGRHLDPVIPAVYVEVVPDIVVHAALEAAAHERREVVGIGQVRERQSVVPAAREEGVYGADESWE